MTKVIEEVYCDSCGAMQKPGELWIEAVLRSDGEDCLAALYYIDQDRSPTGEDGPNYKHFCSVQHTVEILERWMQEEKIRLALAAKPAMEPH
jgi:hypothetical protein